MHFLFNNFEWNILFNEKKCQLQTLHSCTLDTYNALSFLLVVPHGDGKQTFVDLQFSQ